MLNVSFNILANEKNGRAPVVDEAGNLVGILAEKVLRVREVDLEAIARRGSDIIVTGSMGNRSRSGKR